MNQGGMYLYYYQVQGRWSMTTDVLTSRRTRCTLSVAPYKGWKSQEAENFTNYKECSKERGQRQEV